MGTGSQHLLCRGKEGGAERGRREGLRGKEGGAKRGRREGLRGEGGRG